MSIRVGIQNMGITIHYRGTMDDVTSIEEARYFSDLEVDDEQAKRSGVTCAFAKTGSATTRAGSKKPVSVVLAALLAWHAFYDVDAFARS